MAGQSSEKFRAALRAIEATDGIDASALPDRLVRAARVALGVAGAALSLHGGAHRLAIGTSDETAALAERLQFTLGAGPAVDAELGGRSVAADEEAIWHRWSQFAAELFAQTPFRSIVTLPLTVQSTVRLTLDLYLTDDRLPELRLLELATITDLVADELSRAVAAGSADAWLDGPEMDGRHQLWIAVGRLMESLGMTEASALALIWARALALGTDIDTVAERLASGTITLAELAPG